MTEQERRTAWAQGMREQAERAEEWQNHKFAAWCREQAERFESGQE